jgi:beta-lactam-binding protein with PASTA domain
MHASTVILIAFGTSLVTAIASVYVAERFDIFEPKQEAAAETVVPDLKGLSEADARVSATTAQLSLVVSGKEAAADAKPDTVLRQSLPAGQKVPLQQAVTVVLAEALPKVPTLKGLTLDDATKRLEGAGYTLQVAGAVPDAEVPKGQIARQMPDADSSYVKGAAVTVQLSRGPAEVDLPKFIGQPYNKAKAEAESMGLKVAVVWTELGETPTYIVLNQTPAAETKMDPGSEVRFTVNR